LANDPVSGDRPSAEDTLQPGVDDFLNRLNEILTDHPRCPMCGGDAWHALAFPVAVATAPSINVRGPAPSARAFYCINCHFMCHRSGKRGHSRSGQNRPVRSVIMVMSGGGAGQVAG